MSQKRKGIRLGMLIALLLVSSCLARASDKTFHVKYTRQFKIEYVGNGCKRVTDAASRQLLLVPRGSNRPRGNVPVIYTPVQKAVFTSMTQVCLLRPFHNPDIWASVKGVTSPLKEWYIPEIRRGLQKGSIQFIGDAYEPDYEKIQALQPEIVFLYGGPSGTHNLIKKLNELGIPYVVDNDYLESDPFGRMEWLKFIAAFYNQERQADAYFDRAEQLMLGMAGKLQGQAKPKVAWGMIYNGKVYVPPGNSYVAKLIAMSGGDYVFNKLSVGNAMMNVEAFYAHAKDADIFIDSAFPENAGSIQAIVESMPIMENMKAFQSRQVWCLQPWYNQMVDQNDQIFMDLTAIFHPGIIKDRKNREFL